MGIGLCRPLRRKSLTLQPIQRRGRHNHNVGMTVDLCAWRALALTAHIDA
jgi:hypothetical protein